MTPEERNQAQVLAITARARGDFDAERGALDALAMDDINRAGDRSYLPEDTADYGISAGGVGPDAPGPEDVNCLRCGQLAIEHTEGRRSVYGVCPSSGQLASGS